VEAAQRAKSQRETETTTMTTVKQIDRATVKALHADVDAAMIEIAKKYGLKFAAETIAKKFA